MAQKYPITKSSCVMGVIDPTSPEQKTDNLDVVLGNIKNQGTENKTLPEQANNATTVKSVVTVGGIPNGFVFEDQEELKWTASRVLLQMLFPDTAPYLSNKGGWGSSSETHKFYVGQDNYSSNTLSGDPTNPTSVKVSCLNQPDVTIPFVKKSDSGSYPLTTEEAGIYTKSFIYQIDTTGKELVSSWGENTNLKVAKDVSPTVLWDENSQKVDDITNVAKDITYTRIVKIIQPEILVRYKSPTIENAQGNVQGGVETWTAFDSISSGSTVTVTDCCDFGSDNDKFYIEVYVINENLFNKLQFKTSKNSLEANMNDIGYVGDQLIRLKGGTTYEHPDWTTEGENGGKTYRYYRIKYSSPVTDAGRSLLISKKQ